MDVGVFHALQRAFDQHLQLIQIAAEFMLQLLVFKQLNPQPQAGDGRAQIVGNRTEQLAAFRQVAADTGAHGVECTPYFDHFADTTDFDRLDLFLTQRHVAGRPGQAL